MPFCELRMFIVLAIIGVMCIVCGAIGWFLGYSLAKGLIYAGAIELIFLAIVLGPGLLRK